MVTHINHANEIDRDLQSAMAQSCASRRRHAAQPQSVLLRERHPTMPTRWRRSATRSIRLRYPLTASTCWIKVQRAHFMVSDDEARAIMQALLSKVSGYLVPRPDA